MPSFYKKGLAVFGALTVLATATFTGLKIGSSGSTLSAYFHGSAIVNVNSMGAGQSTTTNVTVTGAVVGDHVNVSVPAGDYLSTTSTGRVDGRVSATNTVQLIFRNASGTASFDAGASTFDVQVWR